MQTHRKPFGASRVALLGAACLWAAGCETTIPWLRKSPPPPSDSAVIRAGHVVADTPVDPKVADDLAAAEELYRTEDYAKAQKLFHRIAENTHNPPLIAERARYYEAECLRLQGYYPKAVDTYHRMVKDFPTGVYREQAAVRMLDVANYWLDDTRAQMDAEQEKRAGKRRFVPFNFVHWDRSKPLLDEEGRALQALENAHVADPLGPMSDKALFLAGSVHYMRGHYLEADQLFSQLIDMHANSPLRPQAIELAIKAKNNSTGGSAYDGRKCAEAIKLINMAQSTCPELRAKPEFLTQHLYAIRYQQAEKDFNIAEFYRRTGHYGSAYFYYELVIRRYPGIGKFEQMAKQRKDELAAVLEAARNRPQGGIRSVFDSTRRGWNRYVLGQPPVEVPSGQDAPGLKKDAQELPPPRPLRDGANSIPRSLPSDLMPRQ